MKFLCLAFMLVPVIACAEFLEVREVVKPGLGGKTVKAPRTEEELTLSPELIVSEKHVAEAFPTEENGGSDEEGGKRYKVSVVLNKEGEGRIIAATKDRNPREFRIAILVGGKVIAAPRVVSGPLGKRFEIDLGAGTSAEEARELANKLQPKTPTEK